MTEGPERLDVLQQRSVSDAVLQLPLTICFPSTAISGSRHRFASSRESVRDSQSAWVYVGGFRNPKDSSWYERSGPYDLETRPEEDLEMPMCLSMCGWAKE